MRSKSTPQLTALIGVRDSKVYSQITHRWNRMRVAAQHSRFQPSEEVQGRRNCAVRAKRDGRGEQLTLVTRSLPSSCAKRGTPLLSVACRLAGAANAYQRELGFVPEHGSRPPVASVPNSGAQWRLCARHKVPPHRAVTQRHCRQRRRLHRHASALQYSRTQLLPRRLSYPTMCPPPPPFQTSEWSLAAEFGITGPRCLLDRTTSAEQWRGGRSTDDGPRTQQ